MTAYSGKENPKRHVVSAFKYLNADLERREKNCFMLVYKAKFPEDGSLWSWQEVAYREGWDSDSEHT